MRRAALLLSVAMLSGCGNGPINWLFFVPSQSNAPPPSFGDAPTHEMAGPSSPAPRSAPPSGGAPAAPVRGGAGGGGSPVGAAIGAVAAGVGVAATAIWAASTLECQPSADEPSDDGKVNLCARKAE